MGLFDVNGKKIKTPDYKPSFSVFNSFAVIGDSFAENGNPRKTSWSSILEKMTGVKSYNFAYGGMTTKTWLEDNEYGLAKMLESPPANLYIIALGINDGNAHMSIGTINDIESDDTDSFYSYYGRIIRAVRSHAPNALIMLSTVARWRDIYNPYSDAIKNIGAYYDFAVFDLSKSAFFKSDFFANHQVSNHPVPIMRSAMAEEFKYLVEQELEANIEKYKKYDNRDA